MIQGYFCPGWPRAEYPRDVPWSVIRHWCDEALGQENWYWDGADLGFRFPEHRMMFLLRWS